jgi:hypothetical protein
MQNPSIHGVAVTATPLCTCVTRFCQVYQVCLERLCGIAEGGEPTGGEPLWNLNSNCFRFAVY